MRCTEATCTVPRTTPPHTNWFKGAMDDQQQSQSGQQQQQQRQQQPSGRAEEDAAAEQPAGPAPSAASTAAAAEDTTKTKGGSKAAKSKGGKVTKKGGGKGDADGEPCSNCGTLGATRKCSQCRQTIYCGEKCFKVRVECANANVQVSA